MIETCKTCQYFIEHYLQTIPNNIMFGEPLVMDDTVYGIAYKTIWIPNEPGTGICDNTYSEMYGSGIGACGWCENYMKKTDKKETKHDFSVFDNYKCDGQLVMKFSDTDISIVEEIK
ncbi:MAG: hypothetical protein J6A59_01690 [Lachnospiraceae bacterium]|nr:hypothetical protein [Lachnospiraceae bacterium]